MEHWASPVLAMTSDLPKKIEPEQSNPIPSRPSLVSFTAMSISVSPSPIPEATLTCLILSSMAFVSR